MNNFTSYLRYIVLFFLIGMSIQVAEAWFESFYEGSPDLVLSRIEQESAQVILVEICNQWGYSTGYGPLKISISPTGKNNYQERNYSNISFSKGECRAFKLQKLTKLSSASSRSYSIVVKAAHSGDRSEIKTINNSLLLAARRSTATQAVSTSKIKNSQITEDLWGNSANYFSTYQNSWTQTSFYPNTSSSSIYPNSYYQNSNNSYYNYNYTSNSSNPNGDFNPANPTWEMQQKNAIYVYSLPRNGYWYTYNSTGNNTYYYTPISSNNENYNSSYNGYPDNYPYYSGNFQGSFWAYNNGSYPLNNGTYYSSNQPDSIPYNCTKWQFNPSTGRYEWYCNGSVWGGYGQPDLYLKDFKQNEASWDFVATVCNQGDSMQTSSQIAVRISNGVGYWSVSSYKYMSLANGWCTDISVSTSTLSMFGYAADYIFYVEVDANKTVTETREDNNTSYWRMRVQ